MQNPFCETLPGVPPDSSTVSHVTPTDALFYINLTLYVPCIILQCVNNQRHAQIIVNSLYFFFKWLYMFRTSDIPKHVEKFNEKIKTIYKNLCMSLVYIHIALLCNLYVQFFT